MSNDEFYNDVIDTDLEGFHPIDEDEILEEEDDDLLVKKKPIVDEDEELGDIPDDFEDEELSDFLHDEDY